MSTLTPDVIKGFMKLGLGSEGSMPEDNRQTQTPYRHIVCNRCSSRPKFSTMDKLYNHLNQRHSLCLVCGVYIREKSEFHQHLSKHPQCMLCGNRYLNLKELEQHYLNHNRPRFQCPSDGCDFRSSYHTHIVEHLESDKCMHAPNLLHIQVYYSSWAEESDIHYFDGFEKYTPSDDSTITYKCPGCGQKQPSLSRLFKHIELDKCVYTLEKHMTALLSDFRSYLYDSIRKSNQELTGRPKSENRTQTEERNSDSESDFEMGESGSEPDE